MPPGWLVSFLAVWAAEHWLDALMHSTGSLGRYVFVVVSVVLVIVATERLDTRE